MPQSLLFVDTNIWLDFYRARNEAGLKLLGHLNDIRDQIIMTYQVEDEFKRNRQKAMVEGYKALAIPELVSRPGFLSDAKAQKTLDSCMKRAQEQVRKMRTRLTRALANPTTHDPVYQTCQRCFRKSDLITLRRDDKIRHQIKRRAFRRFIVGSPPRKPNDLSMGDAINWEWIIHCAQLTKKPIHILSRDSDYGILFERMTYLNDHLRQEFKDRVSSKRSIVLHNNIASALKHFRVEISEEEKQADAEIAKTTTLSAAKSVQIDNEDLLAVFGKIPYAQWMNTLSAYNTHSNYATVNTTASSVSPYWTTSSSNDKET